jgi:hypothetical protein
MPAYNKPLGNISQIDTYKIYSHIASILKSHYEIQSVLREDRGKIRNCSSISSKAARTNCILFGFISTKIRHVGVWGLVQFTFNLKIVR